MGFLRLCVRPKGLSSLVALKSARLFACAIVGKKSGFDFSTCATGVFFPVGTWLERITGDLAAFYTNAGAP